MPSEAVEDSMLQHLLRHPFQEEALLVVDGNGLKGLSTLPSFRWPSQKDCPSFPIPSQDYRPFLQQMVKFVCSTRMKFYWWNFLNFVEEQRNMDRTRLILIILGNE